MPILLYGVEMLNLNKSQLNSLDFVANRFMIKRFNINNMQIIEVWGIEGCGPRPQARVRLARAADVPPARA